MIYLFGINSVARLIAIEMKSLGVDHGYIADFLPDELRFVDPACIIKLFSEFEPQDDDIVINCVGYRDLQAREACSERINKISKIVSYVSPGATIEDGVTLDNGVVILNGAHLETGVHVRDGTLIWGGARVCHDSDVGKYCFLAAGSIVGGGSKIPNFSKIGFNSVIEDGFRVLNDKPLVPGALAFVKRDGTIFRASKTNV